MYPRILHLYGPLWINSYGLMIALGFLTFTYCMFNNPQRKKLISDELFWNALFVGLITGILGGRILFTILSPQLFTANWIEAFFPWEGGFSLFGAIIGLVIVLPIYLHRHKVKVLPILDLTAIYSPLMQAIARIGCFLAGCCYGKPATKALPWAIIYFNDACLAPLGIYLHPAQLYSAIASFIIFLILRYGLSKKLKKPGQLLFSYLALESVSRLIVDIWRGDIPNQIAKFPIDLGLWNYQVIVLGVLIFSLTGLAIVSKRTY